MRSRLTIASVVRIAREAALDVAALCVPTHCVICAAPDRSVCRRCALLLAPATSAQRLVPEGAAVVTDRMPPVVSARPYSGAVRGVIVAVKERGRSDAIPVLSRLLAHGIVASGVPLSGSPPPVLVPLPSTRASERTRGFRHMELISIGAVRALRRRAEFRGENNARQGCRLPVRRWLRARPRRDQVGLGRAQREHNVAHTMRASGWSRGRRVVLVDDLITTGSSVREACRALHSAGAQVVAIVTVAYAQRHSS